MFICAVDEQGLIPGRMNLYVVSMEKKPQKKCGTNLYVDLDFQIRPHKETPKDMKQTNSNSHQRTSIWLHHILNLRPSSKSQHPTLSPYTTHVEDEHCQHKVLRMVISQHPNEELGSYLYPLASQLSFTSFHNYIDTLRNTTNIKLVTSPP